MAIPNVWLRQAVETFCCENMSTANREDLVEVDYDHAKLGIVGENGPDDYSAAYRGLYLTRQEYYEYSEYTSGYEQIPVGPAITACPWCSSVHPVS